MTVHQMAESLEAPVVASTGMQLVAPMVELKAHGWVARTDHEMDDP